MPVMSAGTEKTPLPEETVENVSPVFSFFTTMSAPGMTAPSESTTTPVMDAVDAPCANALVPVTNVTIKCVDYSDTPLSA